MQLQRNHLNINNSPTLKEKEKKTKKKKHFSSNKKKLFASQPSKQHMNVNRKDEETYNSSCKDTTTLWSLVYSTVHDIIRCYKLVWTIAVASLITYS